VTKENPEKVLSRTCDSAMRGEDGKSSLRGRTGDYDEGRVNQLHGRSLGKQLKKCRHILGERKGVSSSVEKGHGKLARAKDEVGKETIREKSESRENKDRALREEPRR